MNTPTLFYAAKSWRSISWSPVIGKMIGARQVGNIYVIESWNPQDTHATELLDIHNLPPAAVIARFAHLILE